MSSGKIPSPLITKEHGSWAVLFVPMFVSASVAGKLTIDFLLLAVSALGVFMSYVPVHTLLRHHTGTTQQEERVTQAKFWAVAYLFVGVAFMVPLLIKGYTFLPAIGVLGAISFFGNFFLARKYSKTIASDLIAVAGLTLSAPSAYYVLTQAIDRFALGLYILNFLFFGCSVFYVHMKIRASITRNSKISWSDKLSLGKLNLFYHGAVILIVGFLIVTQFTAQLALIAFVPMVFHGVYGTLSLSGNVRFKNLGLLLLGQSVLFGILVWYFAWQ